MAANKGKCRFMAFLLIISAVTAADYLKVEFTRTLNAGTITNKAYTNFLKELRKKLASTYSKKVPVLPVFNHDKPRGFDVVLTAGTSTTTARFRGDDLYFVGFQMQTGKKAWHEFKPDKGGRQLIKNSVILDFGCGYAALEGIAGSVTKMEINKGALVDAVGDLAGSPDKGGRATAAIVVIQMISEAARFVDVSGHYASNLAKNAKLPEWMRKDLQNNWADLSYEVLKPEGDPCYKFKPQTINKKVITKPDDLRRYFGILHRDPDTLKPPCSQTLYDAMNSVFELEARRFGPMVAQA